MSWWFSARCNPPSTIRRPPSGIGTRKQGAKPDTTTSMHVVIRRRRPVPYVPIVNEVTAFLQRELDGLVVGRNLFPNRLPQRVSDSSNVALLIDSMSGPMAMSYIGAPAKCEELRVAIHGVSHDESHFLAAELLVARAYEKLVVTFNQEVSE